MSRAGEWIRQRRFPAEFRIDEPVGAVEPVRPATPEEPVRPPEQSGSDGLTDTAVAEIATDIWRTKRRVGDGRDDDASRGQRQVARHVRAVWDRLAEAGVEVQEHEATLYDSGMTLDVVAYETDPNVAKETVSETVRPSVYRGGRCIQVGQVIVAQPEEEHADGARDH